jgi:hypothetical protein
MKIRFALSLLFFSVHLNAEEPSTLVLADSNIELNGTNGSVFTRQDGEIAIYLDGEPFKNTSGRIHLERLNKDAESLEAAVTREIDSITERSPDSTNARKNFKGTVAVKTTSGILGLRADFYVEDATTKRYLIVKYYFRDEADKIFKVCAHIYGDEEKFKAYNAFILNNLAAKPNN